MFFMCVSAQSQQEATLMPHQPTQIETYIKENYGTVNIKNGPGRPASNNSMNSEIKARIDDDDLKTIMAFCRGRKIDRSRYIRHLTTLDTDYFDHIDVLNDPEVKELFFHMLNVAKKI